MKNVFLIILVTCLNFQFLLSQNSEFSFASTYQVDESPNLKIDLFDGDIELNSHEKNTIEVKYIVRDNNKVLELNENEFKALFKDKIEFTTTNTNDLVSITLDQRAYSSFRNSLSVDILVKLPKKTTCQIKTGDGDIEGSEITADMQCRTGDGDISLNDVNGEVVVKTGDGDIKLVNIIGDVTAKTGDGDILTRNVVGDLITHIDDGEIRQTK